MNLFGGRGERGRGGEGRGGEGRGGEGREGGWEGIPHYLNNNLT